MTKSSTNNCKEKYVDPGILEVIGIAASVLYLCEVAIKITKKGIRSYKRKQKRIGTIARKYQRKLEDLRAGIILINGVMHDNLKNVPEYSITFAVTERELEVFRRGLNQVFNSIKTLSDLSLELELASIGLPEKADLYYEISEKGNLILKNIRISLNGHPENIPELMKSLEEYISICSEALLAHEF